MVVEICPSVSPRRMNSGSQAGHKGTAASRSSKRSNATCRDRVRTVGASLHPWGQTGCRYASKRGAPTGRSTTPSRRTHRPACHPINDTREASQLSDLSPHCGALQPAQRRPGLKTQPSAPRWAYLAGLRSSPLERPLHHRRLTPGVLTHDAGHRGAVAAIGDFEGACYAGNCGSAPGSTRTPEVAPGAPKGTCHPLVGARMGDRQHGPHQRP